MDQARVVLLDNLRDRTVDAANAALAAENALGKIVLPEDCPDKVVKGLESQRIQVGRAHLHLRKLTLQIMSFIREQKAAALAAENGETAQPDGEPGEKKRGRHARSES